LSDVVSISVRLGRLAEVLLLVTDEVLCASNDTSILDTVDVLSHSNTRQDRVRGETLPVTATLGTATKRTDNGAELHVDTLAVVLRTHSVTALVEETTVEGGCNGNTPGEDAVVVCVTDTDRAIFV